ncbi:MAG: hypothetical protein ABIQ55_08955 [Gemmatimonadaceae bacterium]
MATIIFAGYLVRYPLGGYAWQMAHYLAGFRELGHDVWFYEDTGDWDCGYAFNPINNEFARTYDYGIETTAAFFGKVGFGDRWVFCDLERGLRYGPGANYVDQLKAKADVLVSLGPVNRLSREPFANRASIYIDSDPIYAQLKLATGDASLRAVVDAHSLHFTFGENIGKPGSDLPTGGYKWHQTRQPVAMEFWESAAGPGRAYTTVGKWDSFGRDTTYRGETFSWRKSTEWRRFLELPSVTLPNFELAMDVDRVPGDLELLERHGWSVVDPNHVSADPWRYRDYVRGSRGEFTVAKDMNVRLRSGWFSDRAACYLAAGRPAVEQDTGFGDNLPTGPGLHAFQTLDDAAEAIREIEGNYHLASAHATAVAREYFAADRVLGDLLSFAGF